ncbi:hypothetical protein CKA32_003525 [Geitlerinema sp. FC II]|nr:hypothetical protein CKA32_003525 [Geitlerinema sp. FC II]
MNSICRAGDRNCEETNFCFLSFRKVFFVRFLTFFAIAIAVRQTSLQEIQKI